MRGLHPVGGASFNLLCTAEGIEKLDASILHGDPPSQPKPVSCKSMNILHWHPLLPPLSRTSSLNALSLPLLTLNPHS